MFVCILEMGFLTVYPLECTIGSSGHGPLGPACAQHGCERERVCVKGGGARACYHGGSNFLSGLFCLNDGAPQPTSVGTTIIFCNPTGGIPIASDVM